VEFKIYKKSTSDRARLGEIKTNHSRFETPVFMPVGTLLSIKGL
jgi:queuine tRNA-ribosyltransferase